MRNTPRARSDLRASNHRRDHGTVTTHCRTATRGRTVSVQRRAAVVIRRPPHAGQKPRPLHEKGTSRWWSQASHVSHPNPAVGSPQPMKASNSRSTNPGSARPCRASCVRSIDSPGATTRRRLAFMTLQCSTVVGMAHRPTHERDQQARCPARLHVGHRSRSTVRMGVSGIRHPERPATPTSSTHASSTSTHPSRHLWRRRRHCIGLEICRPAHTDAVVARSWFTPQNGEWEELRFVGVLPTARDGSRSQTRTADPRINSPLL